MTTDLPSPSPRRAVWACYAGMVCIAIAVNLAPIFLTTFAVEFASGAPLTEEEMGLIQSFLFAGLVLGIAVSGPLADRFGGRTFAVLGLALVSAGLLATASARSYVTLLVAGTVSGLGAGVLDMVLSPIVAALEPERKAAAMNWLHSFYCAGALAITFAGSLAIRLGAPWRAFAAASAVLPVATLAAFLRLRVPPLVAEGNERPPAERLLSSPFFVLALAAMLLAGAAEAGMATWLPTFTERVLHGSRSAGAATLSAFLTAMWLGRVVAATVGHRLRPARLLGGSAALAACGYLAGACLPWRPAALAACVTTGFAVGSLWPTTLGLVANRIAHGGATMFGLLAAAGNAGCFLAPWAVGAVADQSSLRVALAWAATVPLAMLATLAIMRTMHPRAGAGTGPA